MFADVDLIEIYQCLCDRTRLRVINLLCHGPLCVCHFQELLNESQVKISKHLGYLRNHGMVEATREANWMVYRLPAKPSPELKANLACLQDCAREQSVFQSDLAKLRRLHAKFADTSPICCPPSRANKPMRRSETAAKPERERGRR
jgi:ArsR family transcriptional regulator